jgi:putative ABC transport system permease protein
MNMLRQSWAVGVMNLRSLQERSGPPLVIVIGTAAAVAVLVSALAMLVTFENALRATARLNRAIILNKAAFGEFDSIIDRATVTAIADSPGIARGPNGKAATSAELTVGVRLPRYDGSPGYLRIRGIALDAFAVHPEIKLRAGRMFRPALHEVIVSARARAQFKDLGVGQQVALAGGPWEIVGEFESDGFHDNEMIADPETVMSAYRATAFQSVLATMASPTSFAAFKTALTDNPQAQVEVSTEAEYQERMSGFLIGQLWFVVIGIGGLLGLGAIFAAINAMYVSTNARLIEIATLRAIGFDGFSMVASVFAEALLFALTGGLAGAAIAWATMDGVVMEAGPIFLVRVTPAIFVAGLGLGLTIGAAGALFPAIRAARLSVATALQIR